MENLDQKAPKSHFQSSGSTCSESQQTSDLKKSGNHSVKVGAAGKHSQLGNIQDKKKQPSATFSTRTNFTPTCHRKESFWNTIKYCINDNDHRSTSFLQQDTFVHGTPTSSHHGHLPQRSPLLTGFQRIKPTGKSASVTAGPNLGRNTVLNTCYPLPFSQSQPKDVFL